MMLKDLQQEILRIKKERDVCILAHSYMSEEICEVADFTGDSYALSVKAKTAPQSTVVMCGVRFMAETVKMLSPQKKLYLPTPTLAALWRSRWIKTSFCSSKRVCPITPLWRT